MKPMHSIVRTALVALVLTNLNLQTSNAATFVVTTTADSGPGSLRQAIVDANADTSPGEVDIAFNIPGSGVQTIEPLTRLPGITRAVTIDGYTQPGASPNTLANADNAVLLIELSGINLSTSSGDYALLIKASDCTVRGLVVNRFTAPDSSALFVQGECSNTVIEGNFVGTDATGLNARPNYAGILIQADPGHRVGGQTPGARNVISGNTYGVVLVSHSNQVLGNFIGVGADGSTVLRNANGVYIHNSSFNQVGGAAPGARNIISGNGHGIWMNHFGSNIFQGNYIGTDSSGTLARGNVTGLVMNYSSNNIVGGTGNGEGNVISGNETGIQLGGPNNLVIGNLIGTDASGTTPIANRDYGVIADAGTRVGGTTPNAGNVITGSRVGVAVYGPAATNTSVLGNTIFGNTSLGIDLGFDVWAPTPNDSGDGDEGANHLQNFPEITSVQRTGSNLKVEYKVDSASGNSAYPLTVEFFIADSAGQGRTLIHRTTYTTPQALTHIAFKPVVLPSSGDQIVATATDANGNTSEFSTPVPGGASRKVTICHEGQTISIDESALPTHLARGDSIGPCP